MILYSIIVLAVAALGGAGAAIMHLKQIKVPVAIAFVHGGLAATGLVLAILGYLENTTSGLLLSAVIVLVVAALAGFYLFSQRSREKGLPKGPLALHVVIGLTGFALLLVAQFG